MHFLVCRAVQQSEYYPLSLIYSLQLVITQVYWIS